MRPEFETQSPVHWSWGEWLDWEVAVARLPEPVENGDWLVARRAIGLDQVGMVDESAAGRRFWLRKWLSYTMRSVDPAPSIVLLWVRRGAGMLAGLFGLLIGWGVAAAALTPQGTLADGSPVPINVLMYLIVCVVPPLAFAVMSLIALVFLGGGTVRFQKLRSFSYWSSGVLEGVWSRIIFRRSMGNKMVSEWGESTERVRAALRLRPAIWRWSAVMVWQVFGLMFAVAVFLNTLCTIAVTDRSFGWQTSMMETGPEQISHFVSVVAFPWKFIAGELAYPEEREVRLSQVKPMSQQGYDEGALKSWWPFLLWCGGVYGIFPRALLIGLSVWLGRRARGRESFDDPHSERVWRLLARPVVRMRIAEEYQAECEKRGNRLPSSTHVPRVSGREAVVWSTRKGTPGAAQWQVFLREEFGWNFVAEESDGEAVKMLLVESVERVLVVAEAAYMSPMRSLKLSLQKMREFVGPKRPFVIVLYGRGVPPSDQELQIWRHITAEWEDPWLEVVSISPKSSV